MTAIKSLHGQKASDRKVRDSLVGNGGESSQEVLTPPPILRAVAKVWPEGITLDPCAPVDPLKRVVPARCYFDGEAHDGLREQWFGRVYCNPPFGCLSRWRTKARAEHSIRDVEVILLGPVRPQRKWTRLESWDRVCFLHPFAFVGFDAANPEPCMATYLGPRVGRFSEAFSELGVVGRWLPDDPRQRELF